MSAELIHAILIATWQTFYMVALSSFTAALLGIPLGVILMITKPAGIKPSKWFNQTLGAVVNVGRSIPFIILMIAIIPFTRLLVGSSIGTNAAIVPLALSAIPFVARLTENVLLEVDAGIIEMGRALGASTQQIVWKMLLPEAKPGIINGLTVTVINLVGYSAMAGAAGGGGLGDLAIRYGYQRFDALVMLVTVVILVIMVQLFQLLGDVCARLADHTN